MTQDILDGVAQLTGYPQCLRSRHVGGERTAQVIVGLYVTTGLTSGPGKCRARGKQYDERNAFHSRHSSMPKPARSPMTWRVVAPTGHE